MRRALCLLLGLAMAGGCTLQRKTSALLEGSSMAPANIDGAYEVVSDTITLTKPEATTERRLPPEWIGMWLFQNGRFSQTFMKQERSWDPFPVNQEGLGYLSSSGTYKVDGTHLFLKHDYSLNPTGVSRLTVVEYKLQGDSLTLTAKMSPRLEDLSEGEQVIILRRIK